MCALNPRDRTEMAAMCASAKINAIFDRVNAVDLKRIVLRHKLYKLKKSSLFCCADNGGSVECAAVKFAVFFIHYFLIIMAALYQ